MLAEKAACRFLGLDNLPNFARVQIRDLLHSYPQAASTGVEQLADGVTAIEWGASPNRTSYGVPIPVSKNHV